MTSRSRRRRKRFIRRGNCYFCEKDQTPDYADVEALSRFISDRGKILKREKTGLCRKHQKRVTIAIKRARHLALLPFVVKP